MTIKAIETSYAGHRFRSRLEARWAVFFDALGIRWEYEPQGYVVDGQPYLPDFWLTDERVFAEVKGSDRDNYEGVHVDKCRALARESRLPVMLLTGPPEVRMYNQFTPGDGPEFLEFWPAYLRATFFVDHSPYVQIADAYWLSCIEVRKSDGALIFSHDTERAVAKSFGRGLPRAIQAARSARF